MSNSWDVPYWRIPGGGVEQGEVPLDAAKREIFEEIGLNLNDFFPFMTVLKNPWTHSYKKHRQFVFIAHAHDISEIKKNAVDGEETLTVQLFPIDNVKDFLEKKKKLQGRGILPIHAGILKSVFKKLGFL